MISKFFKFLIFLTIVTGLSLFYISTKVEAIKLSYEIRTTEKALAQEHDAMKNLRFQLASLKSPSQLENRMVESSLDLIPVREVKVLHSAKKKLALPERSVVGTEAPTRPHFLSVREAQADTQ